MKILFILLGVIAAVVLLVWLGLRVKPAPFPGFGQTQPQLRTIPIPANLPEPVARFYRMTYGDAVPVIETAVVSGRGSMRLFNLPVPIRFRFTHEAGQTYRHDIELTIFGVPWMKANDTYIDGRGWANTPEFAAGPGFDQGSNISLWAETLNWFPAALLTDSRVHWKPVDSVTAELVVPFGDQQETMVIRFDSESGRVTNIEAMKFKASAGKLVRWNNGVWADENKPWIFMDVDEVLLNVPVRDYIREDLH